MLAAVVLAFVGKALVGQWTEYRRTPIPTHPEWGYILLSGAIYLVTYGVLVQTWRSMLVVWKAPITFVRAAEIWCVTSLARYVPGKVWQIAQMTHMATRENVPAVAAAGTAILNVVINIAIGIVIALVTGVSVLQAIGAHYGYSGTSIVAAAVVLILAAAAGIAALPVVLPWILRLASRLIGRSFALDRLPARAIGYAVVGNVIAWVLYGVAFQVLVLGGAGSAPGTTAQYTALYSSSYVLGYLFLVIPGGVGIRDAALAVGLGALHLATPPAAAAIVVVSRIWLTVLEVLPGLLFLAWGSSRRRLRNGDLGKLST